MPNIAGYADHAYVKGQYYKYAAAPMPIVFTGDIDDVSNPDTLLIRAALVNRGQVTGTLPNTAGTSFLITTVQYGTDEHPVYLQTAYQNQTGFEGREYKRIYNDAWSEWIGVEDSIQSVADTVSSVSNTASSAASGVSSLNTTVSGLQRDLNDVKNTTLPGISRSVDSVSTKVTAIDKRTTLTDVSTSYAINKTSGKWTLGVTNVRQLGNCVYMSLTFNHRKNDDVDAGQNGFVGTVTAPDRLKPLFTPCLIGFWGGAIIMCEVPNDGNLQVRVLAGNIHPRTDNPVPIIVTGMFMVAG